MHTLWKSYNIGQRENHGHVHVPYKVLEKYAGIFLRWRQYVHSPLVSDVSGLILIKISCN